MSLEHWWRYRTEHGFWLPFGAEGDISAGGCATVLSGGEPARKQPVGFRGAAPGASLDERGLPRVRVKARSSRNGRTP